MDGSTGFILEGQAGLGTTTTIEAWGNHNTARATNRVEWGAERAHTNFGRRCEWKGKYIPPSLGHEAQWNHWRRFDSVNLSLDLWDDLLPADTFVPHLDLQEFEVPHLL